MREPDHQTEDGHAVAPWQLGMQYGLILTGALLVLTRPYLISAVRKGELAAEWLLFLPALFLAFFLAFLIFEFLVRNLSKSAWDYIRALFGLLIIILSFPSTLREYNVRRTPDPLGIELVEKFAQHSDARIRALAVLASARHIADKNLGALIHKALLDKDPLVQQTAKSVIEENFGIRLKNGAEGIHQAQSLIKDVDSSALLIRKGSP